MFRTEGISSVALLNGKLVCEYSECASGITSIGGVGRLENKGRVLAYTGYLVGDLNGVVID